MSSKFADKMEQMKQRAAGNPALMFISQPEDAAAEDQEETRTPRKTKRSSLQAQEKSAPVAPTPTSATRPAPPRREFKSRRLQLLIQPSLYEEIRDRAEAEGLSVNEEIHNLLRQALEE